MSSSTNLPFIVRQNQNMLPVCLLQNSVVQKKKKKIKKVLSWVSENVRSVVTYVNFDIYNLG